MTWLDSLADKALARELPSREEALRVLNSTDDELLDVVAAAFKVRLRYFGRRVKLNYLVNIKSGLCPEDCFYCSQRRGSAADVLKYTWLKPDEVLTHATAACRSGTMSAPAASARIRPLSPSITQTASKTSAARRPTARCDSAESVPSSRISPSTARTRP